MQTKLLGESRMRWDEAIDLTVQSLQAHAADHDTWCIAWSGGKDSTALLTLIMYLIDAGRIVAPKRLIVCYADTRMELPPLWIAACDIRRQLSDRGIDVRTVMAPLDKRFLVYILGRGVPPPNNNTLRWCTRQIKVDPMQDELRRIVDGAGSNVLMLTGVRQGESAMRDGRIAMSCSKNGAECGQGWYQQMTGDGFATLAPILHWRVCHVWDWLRLHAPRDKYGGWRTGIIADAYGGDEAQEINARTGCICCPLASNDTALDAVIDMEHWSYLRPLKGMREIYRWLRLPGNRLRKPGGESRKDGTLSRNQNRMGPVTLEARRHALISVLAIQDRCNVDARCYDRPEIDLLNEEEVNRIKELIKARTWPQRWTGDEPRADESYEATFADGTTQRNLFAD